VPVGESIVKAAVDCPKANILFYSSNPNYKLIDFGCKDESDNILAFQATTSSTHTANVTHIAGLEGEAGGRCLILYYLHPARRGFKFATDPVMPRTRFCWIFQVPISKPIRASRRVRTAKNLKPIQARERLRPVVAAEEEPGDD